jgi:acyl-CoA synthetase (AMP-forming)/AMP-acid ligase II
MEYARWLTAKDVLRANAFKWPDKVGAKDLNKAYAFKEWNERSCRLANALSGLGMKKGDRFAVLAYNCVEWMEIYGAAAKGGFICVPIMFRLAAPEMEYIINHCEAKVFIVQDQWIDHIRGMKNNLATVENYISFAVNNPKFDGFLSYEDLIAKAAQEERCVVEAETYGSSCIRGYDRKAEGLCKKSSGPLRPVFYFYL